MVETCELATHDTEHCAIPALSDTERKRRILAAGIAGGVLASLYYFSWWLAEGRLADPWLLAGFGVAALYVFCQLYCAWFVYLHIAWPAPRPAPAGLTVDVFVPVYDEPYALVRAGLEAALAMRYPHRTYLLDDAHDPRFRALAAELGVHYLERDDHRDAKAGNVNAALARTGGDYVLVFDLDHLPDPEFLDAVLGQFDDPKMGFVQAGVAFHNGDESDVARATAEQCHDVYGPTSMGMSGCGGAPVWGSHTTFRRAALASVGGYRPGLAEDLHTSVAIHSAGWRSVYEPTVHATGLVPTEIRGLTVQQFKWSRGVFDVWLWIWPRLRRGLTRAQNLSYTVRFTYYLIGPLFLVHALAAAVALQRGGTAGAAFTSYFFHAVPLGIAVLGIRFLANALWNPQQTTGRRFNWSGYALSVAFWPVYTLALLGAIFRAPVPHMATPKEGTGRAHPWVSAPQMVLSAVLAITLVVRLASGPTASDVIPMLVAAGAIVLQLPTIRATLRP
jgi:cellulose synthase (UDP-forming)